MEDYNKVLDATEVAENANGVAAEKMTVYNESLAAAQNRLTASIQQFAQDSNLDQILALAYDGLSKVVEILNILLNKIPILSPMIKASGVALAAAFGAKMLGNAATLVNTITGIATAASDALSILSTTAFAVGSFAVPIWGVVAAITAIGVALKGVYDIVQDNTPEAKLERANQELDESKRNLEDTESQISDLNKQIAEIGDKGVLTLADEQEKQKLEEQRDVLKQILEYQTDINTEKQKEVTKQTGEQMKEKYVSGAIDSETAYERAQRKGSVASSYAAASGDISKLYNTETASVSELTANLKILDEERKALMETEGNHSKELTDNNQKTQENITALKNRAVAIGEDISKMQELGLTDTEYYKNALAQFNEIQAYVNPSNWETITVKDLIDTHGLEDKIKEAIQSGDEAGQETAKAYAKNFANKILEDTSMRQAMANAIGIDLDSLGVNESLDAVTNEILSKFQQMYGKVSDGYDEVVQNVFGKTDVVSAYASILEKVNDKTGVLSKAYKELTKQGSLTTDTTQKLIELYPDLAKQLDFTSGKITLNVEVLKDLYNAEYESAEATVKAEIEKTEATIAGVQARIAALEAEKSKLLEVLDAGVESGRDEAFYEKQTRLLEQTGSNANANLAEAEEHLRALRELLGLIQNTAKAGLGSGTKDSSSSKSSTDKTAKEFENKVKEDMKNLKGWVNLYSRQENWMTQETITDFTNKYNATLKKIIDNPEARKIAADALNLDISEMDESQQIDAITKLLKEQYGTIEDEQKKLIKSSLEAKDKELQAIEEAEKKEKEQYDNALKYIEEIEKTTVSMIETGVDLIQKTGDLFFDLMDKIDERHDIETENLDKIIDKLDDQKDAFDDKIDTQKEYLKLQKEEMDNAKELADKNKAIADIDAQLAELQYDNSAEAQAKRLKLLDERAQKEKDLADWQKDYDYNTKIDALDKEKSEYEKTIKAEKKALEAQKKTIEDTQKSFQRTTKNIQDGFNNFVKILSSDVVKNLLAKALISYGGDTYKNLLYGWNKLFGTGDDADITKQLEDLQKTGFRSFQWIGNLSNWFKTASNKKQSNIDTVSQARSKISIEQKQLETGDIPLGKAFASSVDVDAIKDKLGKANEIFDSTKENIIDATNSINLNVKDGFNSTSKTVVGFAQGLAKGVQSGVQTASSIFDNLGTKLKNVFNIDWKGITSNVGKGLGVVSNTIGQLFNPIAKGAASIGDAIGSGITGFFPGIFTALGTLVTTVGTAMGGVLDAIATAMAAIPVVGWAIAAAAVAGSIALIGTIAAISSKTKSSRVSQPTQSFAAKKHHSGADYVKKENPALDKMLGLNEDETVSILKVGEAVVPTWANNATSSSNSSSYTGSPFGNAVDSAVKSARANSQTSYRTGDSSVNISMPINIQGDADATTVRALKKEADNIVNKVLKTINNQTRIGGYRNIKAATV